MKIKNLTYLSHGIPLVTTTLGARGFPNSEAIIIEDDFALWPSILTSLLENDERRKELSNIASDFFRSHFDILSTTERLVEIYRTAIDSYEITRSTLLSSGFSKLSPIDLKYVYWLREARESGGYICQTESYIKGGST